MNAMKEETPLSRNHHSYQDHRRQFWIQIFLPMILAVLLIIAIAVITSLAAFGSNDNSSIWAAISTIWLIIPAMFFALIFLVFLVGMVYLLAQSLKVVPSYSLGAQLFLKRVTSQIKHFSNLAAKPVLFIEGIKASLKEIFSRI